MRTLRRLGIPTLIFVNKVDRSGAQDSTLLASLADRLHLDVLAMNGVRHLGTRAAEVQPYGRQDPAFVSRLAELVADHDEAFLARYLDGRTAPYEELHASLVELTRRAEVHPVFFGSAITGTGVGELISALTELLPTSTGDPGGAPTGTVFKIERGPSGDKIAYVQLRGGTLRVRDRVPFGRAGQPDHDAKVTAISIFDQGSVCPVGAVSAGRIAKVSGLTAVQIGDSIGVARASTAHWFAPPTLETVVVPRPGTDRPRLYAALVQLAEQDPLIDVRQDPSTQELRLALYGEVQKEVIQATLAADYGCAVDFDTTTTICVERPVGVGQASLAVGETGNPYLAGIGLRIAPAPAGTGITYAVAGDRRGTMPPAFFRAVAETVPASLQGGLYGWRVIDCTVTLTNTGYCPRQSHAHGTFDKSMSSTAGDFRSLTPVVLRSALAQAGTRVHEPVQRFRLELPADTLGAVLPVLARVGAVPDTPIVTGTQCVLDGDLPAARVHELTSLLPELTQGEGLLETVFDHYDPVRGEPPVR